MVSERNLSPSYSSFDYRISLRFAKNEVNNHNLLQVSEKVQGKVDRCRKISADHLEEVHQ